MASISKGNKQATALVQSEIVTLAAYLLGADNRQINIEDIAVKANELAPGMFTWKKYKDQIDRELIYKHLWDLTKAEKSGAYLVGSKNEGWMLTLEGTEFARSAIQRLREASPTVKKKKDEPWVARERVRMRSEPAFAKFTDGRADEITLGDAEKFLRLDDYVIGEARERKLRQAENSFHSDADIGPVLAVVSALLRSKK